jgi:hypothetical protein
MPGRRSPTTTTARESDIESQNDIESPPDGGEAGSPAMTSPDSFPGDRLAVLIGVYCPLWIHYRLHLTVTPHQNRNEAATLLLFTD